MGFCQNCPFLTKVLDPKATLFPLHPNQQPETFVRTINKRIKVAMRVQILVQQSIF